MAMMEVFLDSQDPMKRKIAHRALSSKAKIQLSSSHGLYDQARLVLEERAIAFLPASLPLNLLRVITCDKMERRRDHGIRISDPVHKVTTHLIMRRGIGDELRRWVERIFTTYCECGLELRYMADPFAHLKSLYSKEEYLLCFESFKKMSSQEGEGSSSSSEGDAVQPVSLRSLGRGILLLLASPLIAAALACAAECFVNRCATYSRRVRKSRRRAPKTLPQIPGLRL